jgi:hypothetical protein
VLSDRPIQRGLYHILPGNITNSDLRLFYSNPNFKKHEKPLNNHF